MQNFATRLQALAKTAALPEAYIDQQILSVIRTTTDHYETRMKSLEDSTTFCTLLTWRKQHDVKVMCAALMESGSKKPDTILQIITDKASITSRLCYTCGYEYPHKGDSECPAKGKICSKCHRIGHFASVCKNGNTGRNQQQNNDRNNSSFKNNNQRRVLDNRFRPEHIDRNDRLESPRNHYYAQNLRNHAPNTQKEPLSSPRTSQNNQIIRNISDLTETELVTEFEEFYRQRQLSSTFETDDSSIRCITAKTNKSKSLRFPLKNRCSIVRRILNHSKL